MNEGYFKNGRWIEKEAVDEETGGEAGQAGPESETDRIDDFDEKIKDLRTSVTKNLGDIFGLGGDLFLSEKGRKYLSKRMKKAEKKIDKTIRDIAEEFESAMKK